MEEDIEKIIKERATTIFNENQHFDVPMKWETAKIHAALEVSAYVRKGYLSSPPSDYGDYATGGIPEESDEHSYYNNDYEEDEREMNQPASEEVDSSQVEISPRRETSPYDNFTMTEFLNHFNFYNDSAQEPQQR